MSLEKGNSNLCGRENPSGANESREKGIDLLPRTAQNFCGLVGGERLTRNSGAGI